MYLFTYIWIFYKCTFQVISISPCLLISLYLWSITLPHFFYSYFPIFITRTHLVPLILDLLFMYETPCTVVHHLFLLCNTSFYLLCIFLWKPSQNPHISITVSSVLLHLSWIFAPFIVQWKEPFKYKLYCGFSQ